MKHSTGYGMGGVAHAVFILLLIQISLSVHMSNNSATDELQLPSLMGLCQNGGIAEWENGDYYCLCRYPHSGIYCENTDGEANPCRCKPCEPQVCKPCEPHICKPCEPQVCKPCEPHICKPCEPHICKPCEPQVCKPCETPVCQPCSPPQSFPPSQDSNVCKNGGRSPGRGQNCECIGRYFGNYCEHECPIGFVLLNGPYTRKPIACVRLILSEQSWYTARDMCSSFHRQAHLAIIQTQEKNEALKEYFRKQSFGRSYRCGAWGDTGAEIFTAGQRLSDGNCQTSIVWKRSGHSNIPLTFTNWRHSQPDCCRCGMSRESCLAFAQNFNSFQWNDDSCERKLCAICEISF